MTPCVVVNMNKLCTSCYVNRTCSCLVRGSKDTDVLEVKLKEIEPDDCRGQVRGRQFGHRTRTRELFDSCLTPYEHQKNLTKTRVLKDSDWSLQ